MMGIFCIILMIIFSTESSLASTSLREKYLESIAVSIDNLADTLPKNIDKETRLDSVALVESTVIFFYTLKHIKADNITQDAKDFLHKQAINSYCTVGGEAQFYRDNNIAVNAHYRDSDSIVVTSISVNAATCEQRIKNASNNTYTDDSESQYLEAKKHETGKDFKNAFLWHTKAAGNGNVKSQIWLAQHYEFGENIKLSIDQAYYWWEIAAKNGNSIAQQSLAYFYVKGIGIEKNYDKAKEWYTKAAKQKNKDALYGIAIMYRDGLGSEVNYPMAIKYFVAAAKAGHLDSYNNLAMMCMEGFGTKKNIDKAIILFKKAAEGGLAKAQYNLANKYIHGVGVKEDPLVAIDWYTKAANQDYPPAQHNLGYIYQKGKGVKADKEMAKYWFEKAAMQGAVDSQFMLARLYESEQSFESDLYAFAWYSIAAEQGDKEAKKTNKQIIKNMTNSEYNKAKWIANMINGQIK